MEGKSKKEVKEEIKVKKKQIHTYKKKENWKNATGKPSLYKKEYCEDIVNYFERCQAEILVDVKFFQPNKNSTISTILNPLNEDETVDAGNVKEISQKLVMQRFPTYARYARTIGIFKSTLYLWANLYEEFSDSMKQCNEIAESILVENWLQWTYNSQFAQFILKNNHWYKDKQEVDNNNINIDSKELTPEQIRVIIDKMTTE